MLNEIQGKKTVHLTKSVHIRYNTTPREVDAISQVFAISQHRSATATSGGDSSQPPDDRSGVTAEPPISGKEAPR